MPNPWRPLRATPSELWALKAFWCISGVWNVSRGPDTTAAHSTFTPGTHRGRCYSRVSLLNDHFISGTQ
ncbi:hypothetical protein XELAEV_18038401mg [Xenopus laevis]|uniref:Uncharacterized protein n=1 Tax=Xenopus laevis TaxID=8355 RepID=A0A974C5X2_XENLA|nr:hypothetical protein XELAEV_18038401mg [Xenopus laevis]